MTVTLADERAMSQKHEPVPHGRVPGRVRLAAARGAGARGTRVVLVTGARKGIGRELAEHYLARATVVGCSREPAEWEHPQYRHLLADVADDATCAGRRRGAQGLRAARRPDQQRRRRRDEPRPAHACERGRPRAADERHRHVPGLPRGREADAARGATAGSSASTVAVPLRLEGEAIYAASKAAVVALTQRARPRARRVRHHGQRRRADARSRPT